MQVLYPTNQLQAKLKNALYAVERWRSFSLLSRPFFVKEKVPSSITPLSTKKKKKNLKTTPCTHKSFVSTITKLQSNKEQAPLPLQQGNKLGGSTI